MTRYRLVKKRTRGYEPYYEVQQKIFGFIWVLCAWSISFETANKEYNRLITASKRPDEFEVLRQDTI